MWSPSISLLLTAAFLAGAVHAETGQRSLQDLVRSAESRIVGGVAAKSGEFPHQVSLRKSGSHFCGGSIIDEQWIVTAAHCMFSNNQVVTPNLITVYTGDLLLSTVSSTSQSSVASLIIVHEDYNATTITNDIALIKLASAFTLDGTVVAATSLRNGTVEAHTSCNVSGWGTTSYGSNYLSNALLYTEVPTWLQSLCREKLAAYSDIPDTMICAGNLTGGYDACQGDSGGGLICNDTLTGVVSWGVGCGFANYPGVYTNVSAFRDWVLGNLNGTDSSSTSSLRGLSPAAWGVLFGCLVFMLTFTDGERVEA